jgi:hypothetical protein
MSQYPQPSDDTIFVICMSSWDYLQNQSQPSWCDGQVVYSGVEKKDAINITVWGKVLQGGVWYAFICNEGDNNGTDIVEWQPADMGLLEPEPRKPNPMRMVIPLDELQHPKAAFVVTKFKAMKSAQWFRELERSYNYDLYVQPGIVTTEHYKTQAAKHGLVWRRYQDIPELDRQLMDITL